MKIVDLRVHVVRAPGAPEFMDDSSLSWVFVEIVSDEELVGIGECTNWPRRGNHIVARALDVVRPRLIGRDPSRIEELWYDLFDSFTYLGNRGLVTMLVSGIDMALWDLRGRAVGQPIHQLLGGAVRDSVPLYTHPAGHDLDQLRANIAGLRSAGYDAFKLDPFAEMAPTHTRYGSGHISRRGVREAAEMVAVVREAAGADGEVLIDAHGLFNVASAVSAIRALEPYDLTWFEEPVPPGNIDALRQIRSQTSVDLCVGERLYTRFDFRPVLEAGVVGYLMPDVCWTGGITELRKIAAMAEAWFVPISPHNALGPLQVLAGGHVMLTVPNCYRLEVNDSWLHWYDGAIETPLPISDGALHIGDQPGIGTDLDYDFIHDNADRSWLDVATSAQEQDR